jgi:hypothetical protein
MITLYQTKKKKKKIFTNVSSNDTLGNVTQLLTFHPMTR